MNEQTTTENPFNQATPEPVPDKRFIKIGGFEAVGLVLLMSIGSFISSLILAMSIGPVRVAVTSQPEPPATHPVKFINIGPCQYIVTEQPFTLTHQGDCTNHVAK